MFSDFGKIIRGENGEIKGIVEIKDATEKEKEVKEVNVSYYCFDAKWLWSNIEKIVNKNKAGEYYLTDLVKMAFNENQKINSYIIKNPIEGMGVNTAEHLMVAEKCCKIPLEDFIARKFAFLSKIFLS